MATTDAKMIRKAIQEMRERAQSEAAEEFVNSLQCHRHDCQASRVRAAELERALRLTLKAVELAGWEGDYAAIEARKALRMPEPAGATPDARPE